MPLYEFSCKTCGKRFEKFLRSKESEELVCPACGSSEVKKVVSSFAPGVGQGSGCAGGG